MPGPVVLLLRGAAPRLLAVALLLVGLVAMHAVGQAAVTHGAGHGARTTTSPSAGTTTVIASTTGVTTTPSTLVDPSPAPCHDGAASDVECSSTMAQTAVAQQAVASPPGSLLVPLTALPQRPAPRTAASQISVPASLRVILRT